MKTWNCFEWLEKQGVSPYSRNMYLLSCSFWKLSTMGGKCFWTGKRILYCCIATIQEYHQLCGMQQMCNIITICVLYPPNHCRIPSKYYQHLPIDIMNYDLPIDFFMMYIQVKCSSKYQDSEFELKCWSGKVQAVFILFIFSVFWVLIIV